MPRIDGVVFPNLRKVDVAIVGEWHSERHSKGEYGTIEWRGKASADEPFVKVEFARILGEVSWSRSEKHKTLTQDIRVFQHWRNYKPLDAAIQFGQHHFATHLVNSDQIFNVTAPAICRTGKVTKVAVLETEQTYACYVLFIARSDVASGRVGLWHLRKELQSGVDKEWLELLTYGRTGTWSDR